LPDALAYQLLAIDLDGTLLDSKHELPARNRAALHRAHEVGMRIVVCTGRSFTETRPILDDIGLDLDAAITVGGALLTEVATGRTIDSTTIDLEIAQEATRWLMQHDYTVMWLRDRSVAGFDGYLVNGPKRHSAIDGWFAATPCRMREIKDVPADGHAPLRITVVDEIAPLEEISADFRRAFDGRMSHNVIRVPAYNFTVLEAFDADVDKWYGITRLCRRWDVDPRRTVVIGDDVNDLPMITHAGLGVAVENAKPVVKAAAEKIVSRNTECGVADLIDELLRD